MTSKTRPLESQKLEDFRCPRCAALQFRVGEAKGVVEVKCRKCGYKFSRELGEKQAR
jgi:transcription elongation factor Elf1